MRFRLISAAAAALAAATLTVGAIDRDASMIDTVAFDGFMSDGVDLARLGLSSEIGLATVHRDWSILAALGFGQVSPDAGINGELWFVGLGVKYYVTDLTSVALTGHYESWDEPADIGISGATLALKHRLVPAHEVISPFLTAGASMEEMTVEFRGTPAEDSLTQIGIDVGAGCDFMLSDDMALVLQGGYTLTEKVSGGPDDTDDGWHVFAGMAYYWE
jgi:opacity protein-like surface antigen